MIWFDFTQIASFERSRVEIRERLNSWVFSAADVRVGNIIGQVVAPLSVCRLGSVLAAAACPSFLLYFRFLLHFRYKTSFPSVFACYTRPSQIFIRKRRPLLFDSGPWKSRTGSLIRENTNKNWRLASIPFLLCKNVTLEPQWKVPPQKLDKYGHGKF